MNGARDRARELMELARGDAYALAQGYGDPNYPEWILGFHAQQAVEKAIKAVLAARDMDAPHTHNLRVLIGLGVEHGMEPPPHSDELPRLTPFGALLRYEMVLVTDPGPLDRPWALERVRAVLDWAQRLLV